jgi:hypothetical protein
MRARLIRISMVLAAIGFAVLGGPLARAGADPLDPNPALKLDLDTVASEAAPT